MLELRHRATGLFLLFAFVFLVSCPLAQQPAEGTDQTPQSGDVYLLVNQLSGAQADLNANSKSAGSYLIQANRSFSSLSQRWAFTHLTDGNWRLSNSYDQLCLDEAAANGVTYAVQQSCSTASTQEWTLTYTSNGFYEVKNVATGYVLDVFQGSKYTGAYLDLSAAGSQPTQTQLWLLRPVFLRGVDNALLERAEALKVAKGLPWWKDAGAVQDVLGILKSHGVNTIRIRPSSQPPYATQTSSSCSGNLCYAESDAQDLDLAKRAKNLGMSVELTLLFDGAISKNVPAAWSGQSLSQLETSVYNYVKSEVESFRKAGVMPDLVAVGNEVDNGFLGYYPSNTSSSNAAFAALQTQGLQAVRDAAADTTIGNALPAPLTCIHITPGYGTMSSFIQAQQSADVVFDAMCQSFYPFFHGPLTSAQAASSNPKSQPVEQSVLNAAASSYGMPIFIIEAAEHHESGYESADPWYPETTVGQRQFLIDLNTVVRAIPNNLGMGFEYWDATGVNIPKDSYSNFSCSDGYVNGDGTTDTTYLWSGLTLFDNADPGPSYCSNPALTNYSALLTGMDAVGGKFDSSLKYKLVNRSSGGVLGSLNGSTYSGAWLATSSDSSLEATTQQWLMLSNGSGFTIVSAATAASGSQNVLDDPQGSATAGTNVTQATRMTGSNTEQIWDVQSAGNGYFYLVNLASGLVMTLSGSNQAVVSSNTSSAAQQWQIVPTYLSTQ